MRRYKGKAKCSCGKRAKYKAENEGNPRFRCEKHKANIENLPDRDEENDDTYAAFNSYKRLK